MSAYTQICLATFPDEMSAEIARLNLESAGIPSYISKDDCGGMVPLLTMFTKIRLMIDSSYKTEAEAILDALSSGDEQVD